jgi:alpha-D-ribose 1-methylphosphonate 5-triphosphate synthase subunit PhnH
MSGATIDFRDLAPGFADPVLDSQRSFRAVLDAMASPGKRVPLTPDLAPPAPLLPTRPAADWLRFHTGCPVVDDSAQAVFVVCAGAWPALDILPAGTDAFPDRSATLIAQVGQLGDAGLRLSGPGIDGARSFGFAPMPAGFLAAWKANNRLFPRGVDLILTDGAQVAALPRTVALQAE